MAAIREPTEVAVISKANWHVISAALLTILFVAVLVVVSSIKSPVSDIRIRNATGEDLQNVVVGRGQYGNILRGEVSGYESWGPAYRYARVSVMVGGKAMLLQPEDYFGLESLGKGRFYVVSIRHTSQAEELEIAVEKDQ